MLISKAYAQITETAADLAPGAEVPAATAAPSATEAFIWNIGLVLILVLMFYLLLIRPQQKRFKEHAQMLSELKKGDKVVTTGGLVGTIDKIKDDNEMVIDLGSNVKVTVLRNSIQARGDELPPAANDAEKDKKAK